MKHSRFLIACLLLLSICVIVLFVNRVWVGTGWDMIYRGDITYATDLAAQYVSFRAEHGYWPEPDEINTRLQYRESRRVSLKKGTKRIDCFDCGLYAAYTLEVELHPDGTIHFYCHSKE